MVPRLDFPDRARGRPCEGRLGGFRVDLAIKAICRLSDSCRAVGETTGRRERSLDPALGAATATQQALIAWLRCRAPDRRPLFFLTRSSAVLELGAVGIHEAIIFCSANHSPPTVVVPYPGAPGYEAVASCLASPEVRARTAGVIAWRPEMA
jgi:hypothetical protein